MKITNNYAIDFSMFHKYVDFSWSIDIISMTINLQLKGDHTPKFSLFFGIMNIAIIDFSFYNIHHK
jgi:hypothetical protein